MYSALYLQGNEEIRANATAKATVAAFAASEGHAHPRVVQLPVTEEGFGFNIMGGKEQNSPIYISRKALVLNLDSGERSTRHLYMNVQLRIYFFRGGWGVGFSKFFRKLCRLF